MKVSLISLAGRLGMGGALACCVPVIGEVVWAIVGTDVPPPGYSAEPEPVPVSAASAASIPYRGGAL
jgi:hypothetical protein